MASLAARKSSMGEGSADVKHGAVLVPAGGRCWSCSVDTNQFWGKLESMGEGGADQYSGNAGNDQRLHRNEVTAAASHPWLSEAQPSVRPTYD